MLKVKSLFWINGLFFILFGGLLFFKPELSLRLIIIVLSCEIILSGIMGIIFSRTETQYANRTILGIISVLEILFGIFLLLFPEFGNFIMSLAVILAGLVAIIKGIFITVDSFQAKNASIKNRWILLLVGIIAIIFGIFLTTNAFLAVLLLNVLIGLGMIVLGIIMIVQGFQAKTITIQGGFIEEDFDDTDE